MKKKRADRCAVPVYPYQQRWIDDRSRFAIYLKARQIGITWATMLMLVIRCLERRQKWHFLSVSERQAVEAIEYASIFCAAIRASAKVHREEVVFEGIRERQLSIVFPNGSKIVGLPANPRTARGCSGNVVLDEFAHHQDSAKIWTALYPVTTRGHQLRVLSTPNGKQGKFFELWDSAPNWSRHETSIHEARDQGFNVDLGLLREGCGCEEDWLQEYCCEFLDEATAWLPYSLIESAYDDGASLRLDSTVRPTGDCWLGVDVGRKRDLTVLWLNEQLGATHWTRAVVTMDRARFAIQRDAIDGLMPMVRRCCLDANGVGAQLAEETEERWGSLAEGVSLNGQVPGMIATRVRDTFERGRIKIPSDPEVRKDLHMVRKTHTEAGNVRFEAPRTKDGHADRFWALGLALWAADATKVLHSGHETVERSRWDGGGSGRSDEPTFPGSTGDWSGY